MSASNPMSLTKKLATVLAVSVGLNLFLLGMVVVSLMRRPHAELGPGPGGRAFFRGGGDELFGGESPRFRKMLGRHEPELVEQRHALKNARARVASALEADPFDKARLETELGRLRTETQRAQETMHHAFVELAADMPPEERKRLPLMMRPHGRDGGH